MKKLRKSLDERLTAGYRVKLGNGHVEVAYAVSLNYFLYFCVCYKKFHSKGKKYIGYM